MKNYAVPVFGWVEEGRGSKMENAAIGGVFSMAELQDVGGKGKSAKGWRFLPLYSALIFFWLIAGESESGVCSSCDLVRFCQF